MSRPLILFPSQLRMRLNDHWSRQRNRWQRVHHSEQRLCRRVNHWCMGMPLSERVFTIASRLGDGWVWGALALLLVLIDGAAGIEVVQQMAFAVALGGISYRMIKACSKRPRPLHADPAIIARVPPLDRYSFPSGHTLHAVSFSYLAISAYPVAALVLLPLACLIAASRVALGLHYPSDVAFGAALGGSIAVLAQMFLPL
jgi:undecaprenyl-diphosphatase